MARIRNTPRRGIISRKFCESENNLSLSLNLLLKHKNIQRMIARALAYVTTSNQRCFEALKTVVAIDQWQHSAHDRPYSVSLPSLGLGWLVWLW